MQHLVSVDQLLKKESKLAVNLVIMQRSLMPLDEEDLPLKAEAMSREVTNSLLMKFCPVCKHTGRSRDIRPTEISNQLEQPLVALKCPTGI